MSKVIEDFVDSYTREFDHYQTAAHLCRERCEALVRARGVRAIVTSRAKQPVKLLAKLQERDKEKSYKSSQEIRDDVPDLAGVRIALYFPGGREAVGQILKDNFNIEKSKNFPKDGKEKREGKRFDGYHADRYRLFMREDTLDDAQKLYAKARIEVQVGSVLMHAWAEVEHDLIYKPESGTLSEDEEAILDEVNGLVLAGEVAFERLQRALERRLAEEDALFDSHFDLAAYLHRWWANGKMTVIPPIGRMDSLWELLREAQLNSASKLREYLGEPSDLNVSEPMSDQIADRILVAKPELYGFYNRVLAQQSFSGSQDQRESAVSSRSNAIGEFLSRWIILERTHAIHDEIKEEGISRNPGDLIRWARRIGLPDIVVHTITEIRFMRNQVVHGVKVPGAASLILVTSLLDDVLGKLETHEDATVREAFHEAKMPMVSDWLRRDTRATV